MQKLDPVAQAAARGHVVPEPPNIVPEEQHRRAGHWSDNQSDNRSDNRIAHPQHYDLGAIQVADVIEAYAERTLMRPAAAWHVGQCIRYLLRSGRKKADAPAKHLADLSKARWHLERAITLVYSALHE